MGIGYFGLLVVQTAWHSMVWAVFFGLSSGGMFILQQVIFADFYGREHLGAIRGIV
jgi:MFS family permease